MDSHALHVLEFEGMLGTIAGFAHSEPGSAWVRARSPQIRLHDIVRDHAALRELQRLTSQGQTLPAAHFSDPTAVFQRVRPQGAVLAGDELLVILDFIRACKELREFLLGETCAHVPVLGKMGRQFRLPEPLLRHLEKALGRDGELVDKASPQLAELRRNIRKLEAANQRLLERLLKDEHLADIYQDQFVTLRNGRYVLPVRREAKGRLPGVIHDLSDSGRTVFMEPEASVGIGNELSATRLEERDECRRIFSELSEEVRQALVDLTDSLHSAAHLDGLFAVARWSAVCGCVLPRFTGRLKLVNVRHALLDWQFRQGGRQKDLVPLSLSLPEETRALVITGSNSGGKTVALKTLGLTVLLAQSGLPVPAAEETELEIFDRVFADIGDEQSLSENLSTFTGHLTRMKVILEGMHQGRALILLDELGTGTDPLEGSALGCALLGEFAGMNALTIATTHLGAIKVFAQDQPGMLNGAVRFNLDTLAPEYVLDVGRPGASHALRIAERLGFPRRVLRQAYSMLDSDQLRLEKMLLELEDRERRTAEEEKQTRDILTRVRQDRESLDRQVADLKKERKRLMNEAYQEAAAVVANTRRQMESVLADLRSRDGHDRQELAAAGRQARENLNEKDRKLDAARRRTREKPVNPLRADELRRGLPVHVVSLQADGVIRSVFRGGRKVAVDVKGMEFTVSADSLARVTASVKPQPDKPSGGISLPRTSGGGSSEINLLGKRVDEACEALDRFIDQARLSNRVEIRIVHGFGTGRLMQGIHDWLRTNGFGGRFRLADADKKEAGGGGVTILEL